jgi:hypothetical protein
MPEIIRQPVRMDCQVGLDLAHAVDRMPHGSFPFLENARVTQEGRIESRPGYTVYDASASAPRLLHSIRRLNDPDMSRAAVGYTDIVGNGTILEAGPQGALVGIDTGYSGKPLSLIPFRPDQAPESWMYVYDSLKSTKVRPDGAIRAVGVAPPSTAPDIEYGPPAWAQIADGQAAGAWTGTPSQFDRTNGDTDTIAFVIYNSGSTGWCCIQPNVGQPFWMGERMQVILGYGGGNQEAVVIREINSAITSTTILGIQYDSGNRGSCSIVLAGSPHGLSRNSILQLVGGGGSELIRVLEVIFSPDGLIYSLRCVTVNNHAAGAVVNGELSWYCYTANTHIGGAGEAIRSQAISFPLPSAGTGVATLTGAINAGMANSRPIDVANDYMHVSVFLQNPTNVVNVKLLLALDATPNFSFSSPGNSYIWTVTQEQLTAAGSTGQGGGYVAGDSWAEIIVPISSAARSGGDATRTLANITGVAIQVTTTAACAWGFDWWYLFGTYGPTIQPNAPGGYSFQSRFRDSSTGTYGVPSPQNRYSLRPLREQILVTPAATAVTSVDQIDIYVAGGTISNFLYAGSVTNNNGSPNTFSDNIPDGFILQANKPPDLTALQPWPILDNPWQGTLNVSGTSVTGITGTPFDLNLVSNSVILINGNVFQTFGQPRSSTFLELTMDAGSLTGATFLIGSPVLAAQPLPVAFGPLEGPFLPVVGALGDMKNAGTFYFCNAANLDNASDRNTLEITSPSEPLITGETWNGQFYVGSRENVFAIRYAYLEAVQTPFQFVRLPSPSGFWSRWAICRGPDGVYALGRDGIYRWSDAGGVNITDEMLYPMFPHDGNPAIATNGILPVDMSQVDFMRLSATDFDIRFVYLDTSGVQHTLRYEIAKRRWFLHTYGDSFAYEYLNEPLVSSPHSMQILQLSRTSGSIYVSGGNADNASPITVSVLPPYSDGGDERAQKLLVDLMSDADGVGSYTVTPKYNEGMIIGTPGTFSVSGGRQQSQLNVASLPSGLALYRNSSALVTWTGGPDGPRLYALEFSGYAQPYLSKRVTTQVKDLGFPGWLHHRRMYAGLISNSVTTLTILCQDGRSYSTQIPSTAGKFRIFPIMLQQCIKDLSFGYMLDTGDQTFALFPGSFTIELKDWIEASYIRLAVFLA